MKQVSKYIVLILASLVLANYAYVYSGQLAKDESACNAHLHHKLDSLAQTHSVLYFGESSNFTYKQDDSCQDRISELIAKKIGIQIPAIEQGAIHLGTYKTLLNRIQNQHQVQTVIITLNLRSFGINWVESKLESNLSRAEVFYETDVPVFIKFKLGFKLYNNLDQTLREREIKYHFKHAKFRETRQGFTTVKKWDAEVFHKGIITSKGSVDRDSTDLACHFIKNYAFTLSDRNSRVSDLDDIVAICNKKKLSLILHILPENFEKANALLGQDITQIMKDNVEYLLSRYGKQAIVIDNSQLLTSAHFIDLNWPTEHYDCEGRNKVATKIADSIRDLVPLN